MLGPSLSVWVGVAVWAAGAAAQCGRAAAERLQVCRGSLCTTPRSPAPACVHAAGVGDTLLERPAGHFRLWLRVEVHGVRLAGQVDPVRSGPEGLLVRVSDTPVGVLWLARRQQHCPCAPNTVDGVIDTPHLANWACAAATENGPAEAGEDVFDASDLTGSTWTMCNARDRVLEHVTGPLVLEFPVAPTLTLTGNSPRVSVVSCTTENSTETIAMENVDFVYWYRRDVASAGTMCTSAPHECNGSINVPSRCGIGERDQIIGSPDSPNCHVSDGEGSHTNPSGCRLLWQEGFLPPVTATTRKLVVSLTGVIFHGTLNALQDKVRLIVNGDIVFAMMFSTTNDCPCGDGVMPTADKWICLSAQLLTDRQEFLVGSPTWTEFRVCDHTSPVLREPNRVPSLELELEGVDPFIATLLLCSPAFAPGRALITALDVAWDFCHQGSNKTTSISPTPTSSISPTPTSSILPPETFPSTAESANGSATSSAEQSESPQDLTTTYREVGHTTTGEIDVQASPSAEPFPGVVGVVVGVALVALLAAGVAVMMHRRKSKSESSDNETAVDGNYGSLSTSLARVD